MIRTRFTPALLALAVAASGLPAAAQDEPPEYRDRADSREAWRRGYERGFERGYEKGLEESRRVHHRLRRVRRHRPRPPASDRST